MVSRLNSIITDKRFNELQGFETPMNQKLPHSRNLHWQGCSKGIPKYTRMKFHKEFDLSPSISRFPLFSLFNVDGWLHHHSSAGDSLKDSHLKLGPTRWTVLIYSQNVGPTIHLLTRQKKKEVIILQTPIHRTIRPKIKSTQSFDPPDSWGITPWAARVQSLWPSFSGPHLTKSAVHPCVGSKINQRERV